MEIAIKQFYRNFCDREHGLPLFSRSFWLDATVGADNWDVVLSFNKNGNIIAALPYAFRDVKGFKVFHQPLLTPKLGPYLIYPPHQKYTSRLAFDKKILNELIDRLHENGFDKFVQAFDPQITNVLPFHWRGFDHRVAYTYRIETIDNPDAFFDELRTNVKTDIRKAEKHLFVSETNDINLVFPIFEKTFRRQKLDCPFTISFFERLDGDLAVRDCRKIFIAEDVKRQIHAAVYLVWDDRYVYYLLGGADPTLRQSGAQSLLIWKSLVTASSLGRGFDFEGSMIQQVERFFRAFGGQQTPYFILTKTSNRWLRLREHARLFLHSARDLFVSSEK